MKYLKVFTDFVADMKELGEAERGRLFTAMLEYAETGEEPALRGNERFVWGTAKKNIDNQRESYDIRCKINKANGSEPKRKKANGSESLQEKDKDKEKIKETLSTESEKKMRELYVNAWFKDFWTAYPRKTDKQDALKAFQKLNPDEALFTEIMNGLKKWVAYWDQRKEPEFIPHPATWINKRRWESEPPEQLFRSVKDAQPKRKKPVGYADRTITMDGIKDIIVDLNEEVT